MSHLRWDFVFQRPQHLLLRAARTHRVLFFEEPVFSSSDEGTPRLDLRPTPHGVTVATPVLPHGMDEVAVDAAQRALLDDLLRSPDGADGVAVAWYYTPMALGFSGHIRPAVTVYDCMDELSGFRGASPRLQLLERQLIRRADVVFAGGRSLYEAKRALHSHVHLFPSGVDTAHFGQARTPGMRGAECPDQADLPRPRLGWFGVVDERLDFDLLRDMAARRPNWSFVMIGPVVKIEPESLPRLPNIHWLGMRPHTELPRYLAGWDLGLMPFALNEATRFISPTKTPEYLAAGVPVVSTPVADVVADWSSDGLVSVAADADGLVAAAEAAMARAPGAWMPRADLRLARISWDGTWARMAELLAQATARRRITESHDAASTAVSHV